MFWALKTVWAPKSTEFLLQVQWVFHPVPWRATGYTTFPAAACGFCSSMANEPSELLLLLQTHRCWRLCPANPHFQSCSWGHWFLEQPVDRCEFPSWIKVPGVLNPQASHTPPLSNKKKKKLLEFLVTTCMEALPSSACHRRNYTHIRNDVCPWRSPSFLKIRLVGCTTISVL